MAIRPIFYPSRFYSILIKYSKFHSSKCRYFPRTIGKNHNNFDSSAEIYSNGIIDEDEYILHDENLMYKDMEINNLGSAIGARAWSNLPTNHSDAPSGNSSSAGTPPPREPRFPPPSSIGGGLSGLDTGPSDREGASDVGKGHPEDEEEGRGNLGSHSGERGSTLKSEMDVQGGLRELLEEELREKARIYTSSPNYLKIKDENKQIDERIPLSIGTIEKIKLSEELSTRNPSSKSNYSLKQLKDQRISKKYVKMLEKTDSHTYSDKHQYEFGDDTKSEKVGTKIHTVRVLNVDKLPLEILHHMVAYNLVKYLPAEKVIRLIWRIASYRDKMGDVSYQNLLLDIGDMAPETCRAELVALLSRAHQTISIPFLVDYVRNFGTFSRGFIAKNLENSAKPRTFDFIRYSRFGGSRKLPLVLYRPRELLGYVHLLRNCSAKRYMLNNLKILGIVPNDYKFEKYHAYGTLDDKLADSLLQSERLLTDPELPEENYKHEDRNRPPMYDLIMKASTLGIKVEDIVEDNMSVNPILTKYTKILHDSDEVDVKPTPVLSQLIPLVPLESNLEAEKSSKRLELGYKNADDSIPAEGKRSWSLPWTVVDNSFIYKGNKYILDKSGWRIEENDYSKNWFKKSYREIRRKQSRKLRLKRMAIKLCKAENSY